MGRRRQQIKIDNLARLMTYILAHRPAEFGLVPDRKGFLPFKELLRGIKEEPGFSYVKQSHINEVLIGKDRALFEWTDREIRSRERHWRLDVENAAVAVPKILYIGVRRKAHAHALEKGLRSAGDRFLTLSEDFDMASRIGRRRDADPVVLEVMASASLGQGIRYYPFHKLFLATDIPVRFIAGPPLPREHAKVLAEKPGQKTRKEVFTDAGTFPLDMAREKGKPRRLKGQKEKGWKEKARKLRKRKRG